MKFVEHVALSHQLWQGVIYDFTLTTTKPTSQMFIDAGTKMSQTSRLFGSRNK